MAIGRNDRDNAATHDCRLKGRVFNLKPDATPKTALLESPSKHLLAGQGQKVGMPDHENPTANAGSTGSKGHPLRKPFGKVVHAVHFRRINLFKVCLMAMGRFVSSPQIQRGSIIQAFIQDAMGRWKGVHYEEGAALSEDPTMRLTGMSAETT